MMGYQSPEYAWSLAEFGEPRRLARCDGWILKRAIPGYAETDGMGCYPLFCCQDWRFIREDLADLKSELISLVLVADPFSDADVDFLNRSFNLGAVPFKQHYAIELDRPVHNLACP